ITRGFSNALDIFWRQTALRSLGISVAGQLETDGNTSVGANLVSHLPMGTRRFINGGAAPQFAPSHSPLRGDEEVSIRYPWPTGFPNGTRSASDIRSFLEQTSPPDPRLDQMGICFRGGSGADGGRGQRR